jgi:hypothetical protein
MTRVAVLPHRVSTRGVQAGPWSIRIGGVEHDAATRIVDWDRRAPLEVRSEMVIDPVVIRDECGLDPLAPIALISTWHASTTNARRVGVHVEVDERSTRTIGFAIDPALAGGTVRLVRSVVLARDHQASSPLAAGRVGSILWRERAATATCIDLQSTADSFEIDAVDFAELDTVDSDAAWLLEADLSDPHCDAPRALRLLANVAHPAVDDLLGADEGEPQRLVESVLRWDVARTVVHRALEQQQFHDGYGDFSPGTVGGVAQRLLQLHVPDVGIGELVAMRREAPDRLDALLQGRLRMLRPR